MPGEPPLVGHFVPGIGHKHFGYLVRNLDKLILCVPIIKSFRLIVVINKPPFRCWVDE